MPNSKFIPQIHKFQQIIIKRNVMWFRLTRLIWEIKKCPSSSDIVGINHWTCYYLNLRTIRNWLLYADEWIYKNLSQNIDIRYNNYKCFKLIYVISWIINIVGPLKNTFTDFWEMIWQNNTRKMIMLTNLMEVAKVIHIDHMY